VRTCAVRVEHNGRDRALAPRRCSQAIDLAGQGAEAGLGDHLAELFAPVESCFHFAMDLIDGAAADRVVGVVLKEPVPSAAQEPAQARSARELPGESAEGLRPAREEVSRTGYCAV